MSSAIHHFEVYALLKLRHAPFARRGQPAHADHFLELFGVVNNHGLVVIVENDL